MKENALVELGTLGGILVRVFNHFDKVFDLLSNFINSLDFVQSSGDIPCLLNIEFGVFLASLALELFYDHEDSYHSSHEHTSV